MSVSKPSKSARKREVLALQSLGERLIGLSAAQLDSMALDERLLEAVQKAQQMKAYGALRRQKQLIGKLMRQVDPTPIRRALDAFGREDRLARALFHDAEQWRDRIATEGHPALEDFFALTGRDNDELRRLARTLDTAADDKARRLARRRIFAAVHRELASGMPDTSGSQQ